MTRQLALAVLLLVLLVPSSRDLLLHAQRSTCAGCPGAADGPPDGGGERRVLEDTVRAALRAGEFALARREADRLVLEAPDDAEALALHGDTRWAVGLFEQAEASYERSLSRDPASPRARFGVARGLATRSRLTDALAETLTALAASPDDPDIHALAAHVYERMRRFADAAAAYVAYAERVPATERTAIATARARAQFLRSFGGRQPFAMEGDGTDVPHTVPFRLVRNKVVVPGRVNNRRVEWVVDTGAERTGVSLALADAARMASIATTLTAGVGRSALRRVQLARADRLEVGSLRLRNVPVSIRNPAFDGTPRWQAETLSPLALGFSVVVDYQRRQVTFARSLPDADGDITLPMRVYRLPLVRGVLNARHPVYFVVDTGGEVISISAETAEALDMPRARRIPLRVFGLSGLDEQAFLLPGVDLAFNELEYRKVGLAVLNLRAPSVLLGFQLGGIVGHKMLGGYRVSLDLERSEVRLEKEAGGL